MRVLVQPAPEPRRRDDLADRARHPLAGHPLSRRRRARDRARGPAPQHLVVGPNGSYLTAWCHLRGVDRVFRMDRSTEAERTPTLPRRRPSVPEPIPMRRCTSTLMSWRRLRSDEVRLPGRPWCAAVRGLRDDRHGHPAVRPQVKACAVLDCLRALAHAPALAGPVTSCSCVS